MLSKVFPCKQSRQTTPSPYRHISPQTSSPPAHLATPTLLSDCCRLLEIIFQLTKPEDAGSPVLLLRLLLLLLRLLLNCPLTVNSSVNSLVLSPAVGNNHWGACIPELVVAEGGGGGERERSICCGGGARGRAERQGANQRASPTPLCSRCVRR